MKRKYGDNIRRKAGIEEAIESVLEDAASQSSHGREVAERLLALKSSSDQATEKLLEKAEKLVNSLKDSLANDKKNKAE